APAKTMPTALTALAAAVIQSVVDDVASRLDGSAGATIQPIVDSSCPARICRVRGSRTHSSLWRRLPPRAAPIRANSATAGLADQRPPEHQRAARPPRVSQAA